MKVKAVHRVSSNDSPISVATMTSKIMLNYGKENLEKLRVIPTIMSILPNSTSEIYWSFAITNAESIEQLC